MSTDEKKYPPADSGQSGGDPSIAKGGKAIPSFEELYSEYSERILNLLYRFTNHEQVARDLHQDVFIKVYERMNTFEQRSRVFTWIYRIAVNHALNYLKRERRRVWLDLMDEKVGDLLQRETIETPGFGGGAAPRPDEVLEHAEMDTLVKQAMDTLPLNYRVPFLLYRDEHLSYEEIARVLNLTVSTAASRIHRARKTLIKELGPHLK